jgi:hypothetical protein
VQLLAEASAYGTLQPEDTAVWGIEGSCGRLGPAENRQPATKRTETKHETLFTLYS